MRHHILEASGNEVFFVGKVNSKGMVESAQVVARGNKNMVPAIMNVEAWFGTTRDCIDAALTGRWAGAPP